MARKKKAKRVKKVTKKIKKATRKKRIKKQDIDLSAIKFCPACGSDNIIYSQMRDELICKDCAEIFSRSTIEQIKKSKEDNQI